MNDAAFAGLLFGGLFVLVGASAAWYHLRETRAWVRTPGRRTDWVPVWDESYKIMSWYAVYSFEVQGRTFTTRDKGGYRQEKKPAVGNKVVTVRYDPADPERAAAGFDAYFFAFAGVFTAAGLAMIAFGVANLRSR